MKIKRGVVAGQADLIADAAVAGSRHRALDSAVRLDAALKANPDAARKLGNGKSLPPVSPGIIAAAERDGIRTDWSPQERAFSDYVRTSREGRDLTASGATGAYLVPQGGFLADILFGIRFSSSIAGRCRLWQTPGKGNPATFPLVTADTGTSASQIAENTQSTDTNDPVFSRVVFGQAPIYNMPGLLRLSRNLVNDSAIDLEGMVTEAFAWRLSRQLDADFLTTALAGTSQTSTTAAPTAITYTDVVNWIYTLDLAARGSESAAIVVSPATAKALANLQDSSLRPLLVDRDYVVVNENAGLFGSHQSRTVRVKTIAGVPIVENRNLANIGASNVVGIFAAWDRAFVMRFVEASILRLVERFADYGQISYNAWCRVDGQVGDANAAVVLKCHS